MDGPLITSIPLQLKPWIVDYLHFTFDAKSKAYLLLSNNASFGALQILHETPELQLPYGVCLPVDDGEHYVTVSDGEVCICASLSTSVSKLFQSKLGTPTPSLLKIQPKNIAVRVRYPAAVLGTCGTSAEIDKDSQRMVESNHYKFERNLAKMVEFRIIDATMDASSWKSPREGDPAPINIRMLMLRGNRNVVLKWLLHPRADIEEATHEGRSSNTVIPYNNNWSHSSSSNDDSMNKKRYLEETESESENEENTDTENFNNTLRNVQKIIIDSFKQATDADTYYTGLLNSVCVHQPDPDFSNSEVDEIFKWANRKREYEGEKHGKMSMKFVRLSQGNDPIAQNANVELPESLNESILDIPCVALLIDQSNNQDSESTTHLDDSAEENLTNSEAQSFVLNTNSSEFNLAQIFPDCDTASKTDNMTDRSNTSSPGEEEISQKPSYMGHLSQLDVSVIERVPELNVVDSNHFTSPSLMEDLLLQKPCDTVGCNTTSSIHHGNINIEFKDSRVPFSQTSPAETKGNDITDSMYPLGTQNKRTVRFASPSLINNERIKPMSSKRAAELTFGSPDVLEYAKKYAKEEYKTASGNEKDSLPKSKSRDSGTEEHIQSLCLPSSLSSCPSLSSSSSSMRLLPMDSLIIMRPICPRKILIKALSAHLHVCRNKNNLSSSVTNPVSKKVDKRRQYSLLSHRPLL